MRVDSEIRIGAGELPADLEAFIRAELSMANPEWFRARARGQFLGGIPLTLEGWRDGGGFGRPELVLPRGYLVRLLELARGLPLEVHRSFSEGSELQASFRDELRDYQRAAVSATRTEEQGLLVLPCGAGKTVIGCGIIAALGRSALVLVHTVDLVNQWVEQLQEWLGVKAAVYGGGKHQVGQVTVATVQTLARLDRWTLAELGQAHGVLIIDEAHHGPARTYETLMRELPCRYRFGLTATPKRDDGLTPMLGWLFGQVVYRITHEQLIRRGVLVVPRVVRVLTEYDWDGDASDDFSGLADDIMRDPARNSMIADVAADAAQHGSVLVLLGRKLHCAELQGMVLGRGVRAVVVTSDTPRRERALTMAEFKAGTIPVLLATSLADEGLDAKHLHAVVIGAPGKAEGRTIQRIGRVMRAAPGKTEAVVYDFVDPLVGVLANQAKKRLTAYRKALGSFELEDRCAGEHVRPSCCPSTQACLL